MKPLQGAGWACALWFLGTVPAQAAWDNVFQVCCAGCGGQRAVANFAPPVDPCNPCPPPPVCTTRYVQRCYYQPVTCYQTKTYYEPVTTYKTSFYYEPVTSYRYSCYVDPCTGCTHQVACPTTCYQLRSQCCPVQSWVQRCCQVPVTSYRLSSCWEPVTTCCTPPPPCVPTGYAPPSSNGGQPVYPTQPPAAVGEQPGAGVQETPRVPGGSGSPLYDRSYSSPGVVEQPGRAPAAGVLEIPGARSDRIYPQAPPGSGLSRQAPPRLPVVPPPAAPLSPPTVKLERIVSLPSPNFRGKVVNRDEKPLPSAQLLFVSATPGGPREPVMADASGNFRVNLASGSWLVYVNSPEGKLSFHSKIDVRASETRQVLLVSR